MSRKAPHYDIAIIGGGLAGISLAAALLSHPPATPSAQKITVALIDKNHPPTCSNENNDARALALSFASLQCLKTLDLWPGVARDFEVINEVQISSQGSFGVTRLNVDRCHVEPLGAVVNAEELNVGLYQALLLKNLPEDTLKFYQPESIVGVEKINSGWEIELAHHKKIQATVVVGADGSDSFLRRHLGIGLNREPYSDCAIITNIIHTEPHGGIAFERFTKSGSLAFLPFGNHRSKCVRIVPKENVEHYLGMGDKEFLQDCQKEFGFTLGVFQACSTRIKYNLQHSTAENFYGLGWVLIGNAANTLPPIAAQGFNLALRDVATLAEMIIHTKKDAQAMHGNLSEITWLQDYANRRHQDHHQLRQFTHHLSKNTSLIDIYLKKMGILVGEFMPFLDQKIAQMGLGTHLPLPKLSRGVTL